MEQKAIGKSVIRPDDPFLAGRLDMLGALQGSHAFVGPEHVVVDLTNRCDSNCVVCWTESPFLAEQEPPLRWKAQTMPFRTMLSLIDDLARLGTKMIRFTGGGEPFMHPNIFEFIEYVKSRGLAMNLTTNLTRLDRAAVEHLVDVGVDELTVSLWAGSPLMYGMTHPNKTGAVFERIEDTLAYIGRIKGNKGKPEVSIANVVFNMNYREFERMIDFAERVRADAVYFTVADVVPGKTDVFLMHPEHMAEFRKILDRMIPRIRGLEERGVLRFHFFDGFVRRIMDEASGDGLYDREAVDRIPCYVGWYFARILADGSVCPCCRGVRLPMGNIKKTSFEVIWNSDRYEEFRYNAKHFKKDHPYFHPVGCHRTCDNLMHNEDFHRRISGISEEQRGRLMEYLR